MNRALVIRASIIFGILVLAILIPLGLEAFTQNEKTPTLSNPDDVYLTVDGVEITNGDLWNTMKNVDGIQYLVDYTLEFLLADEIAALTQDEIDAEVKLLTYLTDDEDQIAQIMEDDEIHQEYLDAFNQNLIVMGYDPGSQTSVNSYVALGMAKTNYTKALIEAAEDGDADYLTDIDVESYYQAFTKGDVCSVDIRFSNESEVTKVFKEFNLVLNYEGGIGEYIGTEEIDTVLQSEFDSTNTLELSDAAVFSFYIKIYNYMNPWADPIDELITQEDYCANHADIAVKNYDDMTNNTTTENPNNVLASYIFNTLKLDDSSKPYSFTNTKAVGDFTMLSYKVSEEEVTAFADLDAATKAELMAEVVSAVASDAKVTATIDTLMSEAEFEIFDKQLKLKYEFAEGITFDNKGSKTLVAKINDKDITVDEFFEYMESRIGVFYSVETAKAKLLLDSDYYENLYGTSRDYFNSNNEKMKVHVADLDEMKALFGTNAYANYGYSSADMNWNEFLYLAFGLQSETDVIENMFVIPSIQNEIMHEQIDYDDSITYMEDQNERYYSLGVNHVLLYIDFDYDFIPDDFQEFKDGLDGQDAFDFETLLLEFQNTMLSKVNDDEMSFDAIVKEYSETLLTDETSDWAQFKQAGLFILTEDLGEISQQTDSTLDEAFVTSLKRIYDVFSTIDSVTIYNDDQITLSEFGVHFIAATQGANFEKHSAMFTDTDNDGDPENDSELPNLAQVELYLEIQYAASTETNTTAMFHDDDVYAAVAYYYGPIYQSYMTQTAFGAYMAQYIIDNNGVYAEGNTEKATQLEAIATTLYEVNYPNLFGTE